MLNQIIHTAKAAVNDINNYLKTNAEICMDFMHRLNSQVNSFETTEMEQGGVFQRLAAIDIGMGETENYGCFEENY